MLKNPSLLEEVRRKALALAEEKGLLPTEVAIRVRPLTPEEAIGNPERRDYPIIEGMERLIEADVSGSRGQAFTDTASDFSGRLGEILALPLDNNRDRALFIASLNALLRHLGRIEGTVHCRDQDPEECAREIAAHLATLGARTIGLIGLNPAIAEALIKTFGASAVRIADLNRRKIGMLLSEVEIRDGRADLDATIEFAEWLLVTGTTLVNGTYDAIAATARARSRRLILYGVTAAGVCGLMNLERLCPKARN
jgi:hypothetical protein